MGHMNSTGSHHLRVRLAGTSCRGRSACRSLRRSSSTGALRRPGSTRLVRKQHTLVFELATRSDAAPIRVRTPWLRKAFVRRGASCKRGVKTPRLQSNGSVRSSRYVTVAEHPMSHASTRRCRLRRTAVRTRRCSGLLVKFDTPTDLAKTASVSAQQFQMVESLSLGRPRWNLLLPSAFGGCRVSARLRPAPRAVASPSTTLFSVPGSSPSPAPLGAP